jgi:hypothetical protein
MDTRTDRKAGKGARQRSALATALLFSAFTGTPGAFAQSVSCEDLSVAEAAAARSTEHVTAHDFYLLGKRLRTAFESAEPHVAGALALEYLRVAKLFPLDWNYGNAVHEGNATLGLLALRQGDELLALRCLEAAGKSPGSPQLNSFGPNMHLALELSRAGRFKEVAAYLDEVAVFWKMDDGQLSAWKAELAEQRVPNFSNLRPHVVDQIMEARRGVN